MSGNQPQQQERLRYHATILHLAEWIWFGRKGEPFDEAGKPIRIQKTWNPETQAYEKPPK